MTIWEGNYNVLNDALNNALEERNNRDTFEAEMFDMTKLFWRSYGVLKGLKENSILLETCILAIHYIFKHPLSIADIGGGCGMHLIDILNAGLEKAVDKYYLIESKQMSDSANRMNSTKEKAIILNGFPYNLSSEMDALDIDLIYLNCSFQYIFPTEKSVEKMKDLNPKVICIDRVLAGQIQTFYTVQKNLKYDTVAKFMNEDEFISLFELNGYEIVYKYERNFNWDMDNFKEEIRLKKLPSYIFIRKDQAIYKEQITKCINGYISQGISFFML